MQRGCNRERILKSSNAVNDFENIYWRDMAKILVMRVYKFWKENQVSEELK